MRRRQVVLLGAAFAILYGANSVACAGDAVTPTEAVSSCADALDLIVCAKRKAVRVQIRAELDQHTASSLWSDTAAFQRLLSYYDRNNDTHLDQEEAARLPSAFALRQMLWRPLAPFSGAGPTFGSLDLNNDGRVVLSELADHYRRGGLGNITVAMGKPPSTDALTAALVAQLDTDRNGRIDEQEGRNAAQLLRRSDADGDELIGPGDLLAGVAYPGAIGAVLLSAPNASELLKANDNTVPVIVLPSRLIDTHWAAVLTRRYDQDGDGRLGAQELQLAADKRQSLDGDGDGTLTADEIAQWRRLKPDLICRIRLDEADPTPSLVERAANVNVAASASDVCLEVESLQTVFRPTKGTLRELIATRKRRFENRFADADVNQDGLLDADEVSKRDLSELKNLLDTCDHDGDSRLSRLELSAWLDLQEHLAQGHILLTLFDYGAGLFELLDADHNGGLSARELRVAWPRLLDADCVREGAFDVTTLPHLCFASISHGHPQSAVAVPRRDGPQWFLAMDRNGDGDVSTREFLGLPADFRLLDADDDGLLSASEARLGDVMRSARAETSE